jgi:tetratricopeptide (TPR) repeat protein
MNPAEKCPICGRPLPQDAPRKLCPACLFEGVLASAFTSFDDAEPHPALATATDPEPTAGASHGSAPIPGPAPGGTIVFETNIELPDHEILASVSAVDAVPPPTDDDLQQPLGRSGNGPSGLVAPRLLPSIESIAPFHRLETGANRVETRITTSDAETPTPGSDVLDAPMIPGYTITDLLGCGGMGVVYKAVQQQLKRTVALKMIRSDMGISAEQLGRFRLEAEAVARLRHPNIVQIYEVGAVGNIPYFSLELLEGGTLDARLAVAPMPTRQAAELALRLARGVAAVHQVGIVHRDLKPANVLFDVDGTPKLSDFGLAKRVEVEQGPTVSGQVMGTPSYMAPEQAEGLIHKIGPAADIYALGAILYEMITGRPPFKGTSMMETLHQVVYEDVVPPSRFQSKVSRDLETICLKCLAKEPSRRYATAGDLADDLGRMLAGEAILARPTPAWERAAKWARRRPATAAMIGFGLATALGLAATAAAYTRHEETRIEGLRLEAGDALDKGRQERTTGALDNARVTLTALVTKLRNEPRLDDFRRRAAAELSAVEHRRAAVAAAAADLARYNRFGTLRDEALQLAGTEASLPALLQGEQDKDQGSSPEAPAPAPTGEGLGTGPRNDSRWKQIRRTVEAALEVFPLGTGSPASPTDPLPATLAPEQRAAVEADRYLLLLVLSEAVARPVAGEDERRQAGAALRLLDRAETLRSKKTAAYHLRRADCLEQLGDEAAARREHDLAARLEPEDALDHLLLGREQYVRGDWAGARKHFEASALHKPDSFWAHFWLAEADLNSNPPRAEEAKGALTTCLIQQPSYAWLYLLRGSAYGQLGAAAQAAAAQASAARLQSMSREFASDAETQFEHAESDFRTALEKGLKAGSHYVLLMNRGVMRYRRKQWDAAANDFRAAIALEPRRYMAYASLAPALRRLGRRDEALEQMNRAIALEPGMAALYHGRALARLDGGDLPADQAEQALRDLEESARLEPAGSRYAVADHIRRGRLLLNRARPQEALAAADAALAIAPDSAQAHGVRIGALLQTERYDEVLESCDVALAGGAATAELYRVRGLARAARDDFAGAIDDYTHALALHPEEPAEVHRNRGWSHLLANAFELAERDFNAVLQLASDDADGHAGRGAARVRLGRVREAIADAEESLRPGTPSPRLLYVAAQTYARASSRALAEGSRRGRPATSDSLAYEARSAELLQQALERTPAERRSSVWRDVVAQDPLLRPLLRNPRVLQWLRSTEGPRL